MSKDKILTVEDLIKEIEESDEGIAEDGRGDLLPETEDKEGDGE